MKIEVIESILPLFFRPRGESGLPTADCFQLFYTIYVDGEESIGAGSMEQLQWFANATGFAGTLPTPCETVFAGW